MFKKNKWSVVLAGAALLLFSNAVYAELPSLIPRSVLFGNAKKTMARLSPDGLFYTYLAPSAQGVLNIWMQDINSKQAAEMLTDDQHRGIRNYQWAKDGEHILYLQDKGGDENWHLFGVDIKTKKSIDYTPFPKVRVNDIEVDKHFPTTVMIELNKRDPRFFDVYRLDLKTGQLKLDTQNPGDVEDWIEDTHLQVRGAMVSNDKDGSTSLRVRDNVNAPWHEIMHWPFGSSGSPVQFSTDDKTLYIISNLNSDTSQLQAIDASTGKMLRTIFANPYSDLGNVIVDEDTYNIQAISYDYLRPEWQVLDHNVIDDFARIRKFTDNSFAIVSRDAKNDKWLIAKLPDNSSPAYYLYNRKTKEFSLLFVAKPELAKYKLASVTPVVITASDGLGLVSYLTLPVGLPASKLPLILNVHGGPWARDDWGYDAEGQWLANRGYAVLQVNYRGSTGFGKKFLNAGNGQWGVGTMQRDLTEAVNWAIKRGIADPKQVCIYGGSYGGYATLAGLAFTPQLYRCGVDIVGPANLQTLVAAIPPYWQTGKKEMLLRIGDVEHDSALNEKISPLFHINNIRAPLLIAQGLNDPRVNINQATSMVNALRKNKLAVEYIVYTDEGHGFARPDNRMDFYGRVEDFLIKYLTGRAEPWQKVAGSSAEVR